MGAGHAGMKATLVQVQHVVRCDFGKVKDVLSAPRFVTLTGV